MQIEKDSMDLSEFLLRRFNISTYRLITDGSQGQFGEIESFLSVKTKGKLFGPIGSKKLASVKDTTVFFEEGVSALSTIVDDLLPFLKSYEKETDRTVYLHFSR